jgi:hypothetical protein
MLIMFEHFSKWNELAPLWNNGEKVIYALWDLVLNIFGHILRHIIILGRFQKSCEHILIEHNITSCDHLKVDMGWLKGWCE